MRQQICGGGGLNDNPSSRELLLHIPDEGVRRVTDAYPTTIAVDSETVNPDKLLAYLQKCEGHFRDDA
jgi:hypothetical protein